MSVEAIRRIGFAGNAVIGMGGQGEFLRQMVFALDVLPDATIFSRWATAPHARCIPIPFSGVPQRLEQLLVKLPWLRGRQDWRNLLSDWQFDRAVARQVPDLDLFDGVSTQCHETFRKLKASTKTRLVLTSLNTHIDTLCHLLKEEYARLRLPGKPFVHPRMRRRALEEIGVADRIRVNSHIAKATFVEHGTASEKIRVIHPAIDHRQFHPTAKNDALFRVLAVSSIDARKGSYYLLQAFEQARLPNSELLLIGGTGDRWFKNVLRNFQARTKTIRVEAIDVMRVPVEQSYGRASVLVHAALEDGYGLVIPQALASGCPVIASRNAGASELVQDGVNGFVIEPRSVPALVDRLRLLATDDALLHRLSQAAPGTVAHLTYENFGQEMRAFYKEIL